MDQIITLRCDRKLKQSVHKFSRLYCFTILSTQVIKISGQWRDGGDSNKFFIIMERRQ